MQFLRISRDTTLSDLQSVTGSRNLDAILHINQIPRTRNIGKAFDESCKAAIDSANPVDFVSKIKLLNQYVSDSDIFETISLANESSWKLLNAMHTIQGYIQIPSEYQVVDSINTIGNGVAVTTAIYNAAVDALKRPPHYIDPSIFGEYSTVKPSIIDSDSNRHADFYQYFKIPWGEVTLYSSLADESMDFPVYPESVSDGVSANYSSMPDLIYQYEPWQLYTSSGPRSNTYSFDFHRDMWTGNHNDGMANKLIRFCMANCYPEYNGSAVNTSLVTLYIHGKPLIRGILTNVSVTWDGPIGHDGWYLHCNLQLQITEVSADPLNYGFMMKKPLIG